MSPFFKQRMCKKSRCAMLRCRDNDKLIQYRFIVIVPSHHPHLVIATSPSHHRGIAPSRHRTVSPLRHRHRIIVIVLSRHHHRTITIAPLRHCPIDPDLNGETVNFLALTYLIPCLVKGEMF